MKLSFSKKQKKMLARIIAGVIIFAAGELIPFENIPYGSYIELAVFLGAYLAAGGGILLKAGKNILRGQIFDENFLMCIASLGAFFVGQYSEGVEVMIFFLVGELFESYAVEKSRRSISGLMDIRPDSANVIRDGNIVTVSPEEVKLGETIAVSPGERIPLDGVVTKGSSSADTSALTGESVPRDLSVGSEALSGCINQSGVIEIEVEKEYGQSTVARILELVENSASSKAKTENFITKFARYYTPAVCILALALAVIPSLITGQWSTWIYRALTFLVVSCPCALVISVPLGFFAGIGAASSKGILVKGSNYLEALSHAEVAVMDKTGTLTKGSFEVTEIKPEGISAEKLIEYAAYAEYFSSHPISVSLKKAYGREIDPSVISSSGETAGSGVNADIEGHTVCAGKAKYIENITGKACPKPEKPGTAVYVSRDGSYIGYVLISDEIKDDAKDAVSEMHRCGISKTVMLTGDSKEVGRYTAEKLGLDEVFAELLPDEKVSHVAELKKQTSEKGRLIYVGDGINDAPVLACADIGIAMGGLGSDAAIEAADIVIMDDKPSKIPAAIRIARRTLAIVTQNIVFSLGVKAVILILGALGIVGMQAAVFADVGVMVIAVLNSVRALKVK
ncbi:MAG: cadmium-translocating P-type ATPase [Oscillospiraceae bacterium]|nr:cadmium-translocating P-type ATPase [Oscillospiraceae bacterium]